MTTMTTMMTIETPLLVLAAIPGLRLVSGSGDYGQGTANVIQAAAAEWRLRTLTVAQFCPVLEVLYSQRNDGLWPSDEARTAWGLAAIPRIMEPHNPDLTRLRAEAAARCAVREIAPAGLEAAGLLKEAASLRALPAEVSMNDARLTADAAAGAAARAAGAADEAARACVAAALAAQADAAAWREARAVEAAWRSERAARATGDPEQAARWLDRLIEIAHAVEYGGVGHG